jgi:hypothetical protein
MQNANNTGTKKGSIMKKLQFEERKNRECAACLKNFVHKSI